MKTKLSTVGLAVLLGLNTSHSAQAALVDAVEYYYSGHYFLTSFLAGPFVRLISPAHKTQPSIETQLTRPCVPPRLNQHFQQANTSLCYYCSCEKKVTHNKKDNIQNR